MRPSVGSLWVGVISAMLVGSARAQAPSDSACRVRLNDASPDSQTTQLAILVSAPESPNLITPHFATLVGQGIAQSIRLPKPLALDVYEARMKGAWLTLKGTYLVSLHRDGHLTRARAVSGTRNPSFDAAVVAGIVALDTSGMLPAPDSATMGADSIELRVAIAPEDASLWRNKPMSLTVADGAPVPLVRIRVPIREGSGGPYPRPGNRAPLYPTAMRQTNTSGSLTLEFVVKADGTADMGSIQVTTASAAAFVRAVVDALPAMRFFPLTVEECPRGPRW